MQLIVADCASAQTCPFPRSANLPNGAYRIHTSDGIALDEDYGLWDPGTKVQGWAAHRGANQLWLVEQVSSGRYLIRSAANGKALDLSYPCHTANGCPLITWPTNRGETQLWKIETTTGGLRIRLASNGKQVGFAPSATCTGTHCPVSNGAVVVSESAGCGANEVWQFTKVGTFRELPLTRTFRVGARLNNYTPNRGQYDGSGERAFYRPNDGKVQFAVLGANLTQNFYIPVTQTGPDNMLKVYINQINRAFSFAAARGASASVVRIDVPFEDAGTEILTDCYNNFLCAGAGKPSFDLTNIDLGILISPRYDETSSRFTYTADVKFDAQVRESSICVDNFWAFLCDLASAFGAPNRDQRADAIRSGVEATTKGMLERPQVRSPLEAALNLAGTGFRNVTVDHDGTLIFWSAE